MTVEQHRLQRVKEWSPGTTHSQQREQSRDPAGREGRVKGCESVAEIHIAEQRERYSVQRDSVQREIQCRDTVQREIQCRERYSAERDTVQRDSVQREIQCRESYSVQRDTVQRDTVQREIQCRERYSAVLQSTVEFQQEIFSIRKRTFVKKESQIRLPLRILRH